MRFGVNSEKALWCYYWLFTCIGKRGGGGKGGKKIEEIKKIKKIQEILNF